MKIPSILTNMAPIKYMRLVRPTTTSKSSSISTSLHKMWPLCTPSTCILPSWESPLETPISTSLSTQCQCRSTRSLKTTRKRHKHTTLCSWPPLLSLWSPAWWYSSFWRSVSFSWSTNSWFQVCLWLATGHPISSLTSWWHTCPLDSWSCSYLYSICNLMASISSSFCSHLQLFRSLTSRPSSSPLTSMHRFAHCSYTSWLAASWLSLCSCSNTSLLRWKWEMPYAGPAASSPHSVSLTASFLPPVALFLSNQEPLTRQTVILLSSFQGRFQMISGTCIISPVTVSF